MELALRAIADGRVDVRPWLGEPIGLYDVATAVAEMSGPTAPIRTVVDPRKGRIDPVSRALPASHQ